MNRKMNTEQFEFKSVDELAKAAETMGINEENVAYF